MATKKISELTEVTSPTSTDVFPIVNDGETKKVQLTNIKNTLGITAIDTRLTTAETDIDGLDTRLTTAENGWVSANETWTYASVDGPTGVITISGDVTTKYSLGMKVKFTQSATVKFGIITAITSTQITLFMGTDYTLTNAPISDAFYSIVKAPYGFPMSKNKWSIIIVDTNELSQASPSANTYYNLGSLGISVPIGAWDMSYEFAMEQNRATADYLTMFSALSTSNNSVSDNAWVLLKQINPLKNITQQMTKQRYMEFTNKTQYYLIIMTDQSSTTNIKIRGSLQTTTIKAVCAYL